MKRTSQLALFVFWSAFILMLIALTGVALAQDGTPPPATPAAKQPVTADDVNRVAKQMYCPVCENEPLDACGTAACQQWRAQIAQMLSDGQSDQQIKDYFMARYGVRVLAQPPATGISLWLYVLPIIGLVVGAIVVVLLMRRMRARAMQSAAPSSAPPASGDEYADRVERDLQNW
jgi:cytochrome c-type biogenesis protein CcmH